LQEKIRLIEREGGAGMLQLADQCRTALAHAGFNVGPRDHDGKKKKSDEPPR